MEAIDAHHNRQYDVQSHHNRTLMKLKSQLKEYTERTKRSRVRAIIHDIYVEENVANYRTKAFCDQMWKLTLEVKCNIKNYILINKYCEFINVF